MASVFDDIAPQQQTASSNDGSVQQTASSNGGSVFDDIAAPASPPSSSNPMLPRIDRGILAGFNLPETAEAWKQLNPATWTKDVITAIHEGRYGHAAAAISQFIPGANLVYTGYDQLQRGHDAMDEALQALHEKRYGDAANSFSRVITHVGVAGLQAAGWIPEFTIAALTLPAVANAADEIAHDNVAGGLAQMVAGGVSGGLLSHFFHRLSIPAEPAVASPQQLAAAATAKRAQSAKLLNEAFKPDAPIPFNKSMFDYALPLLEETRSQIHPNGDPLTYKDLPQAVAMAKENNRVQFKAYEDQARQMGLTGNDAPIAKAMKAAIPDKVRELYPDLTNKLEAEVDKMYPGKDRPAGMFGSFNRTNNAVMGKFYDKLTADQNEVLAANTTKAMQDAEADANRDVWYKAADKAGVGGENMRELQRRWGALKELEDEHEKLKGRLLNQDTTKPPFSPVDLAKWLNPKGVGLDMLKQGLSKALNQYEQDPRVAVNKINQAFANYKGGTKLPPVPGPNPWGSGRIPDVTISPGYELTSPGKLPGPEQLMLHPVDPPPIGGYSVKWGFKRSEPPDPPGYIPPSVKHGLELHPVEHQAPVGTPEFDLSNPPGKTPDPINPNDLYELMLRQRKAGQQPAELLGPKQLPPATQTIDIMKWLR